MTRSQFLSAVAKGLGRAVLALRSGDYTASLHDMRRLVLRWPGYDGYMEGTRGWYVVELIDASGMAEELSEIVIRHLPRIRVNEYDRSHREAIVTSLAARGSHQAKDALYVNFDPANEFRLANEIIEIDGLAGLDWVIRHSTGFLDEKDRWRFDCWVDQLKEALGSEVVEEWLEKQASARLDISEFAEVLAVRRQPGDRRESDPNPAVTFEEMRVQALQAGAARTLALRWTSSATEIELAKAWRAFEDERDEEWLYRLARALRRKPQFCDLEKSMSRAREWRQDQNPFVTAMDEIIDPRLRDLGFELIAAGWVVDGISLLERNAIREDETEVLSAVKFLTDNWDLHSVGMDLTNLGERIESSEILLWTYENNPCSVCREFTLRALIKLNKSPDWLLRESSFDCLKDTRDLAAEALKDPKRTLYDQTVVL